MYQMMYLMTVTMTIWMTYHMIYVFNIGKSYTVNHSILLCHHDGHHDMWWVSPWHITWHMSAWHIAWHIHTPERDMSWWQRAYVIAVSNAENCHAICHAGVLSSWPVIWYVIWYVMLTFICHVTRHCDIFTYFFKVGNMTYQKSSICHADTAMTYTYMSCDMSFDSSWCHMSCDMSCCIFLYRCNTLLWLNLYILQDLDTPQKKRKIRTHLCRRDLYTFFWEILVRRYR